MTTYYVANAGSDGNNGTSTSTPWQTISHVNAQSFVAGDSILFNRGDIWRELLLVPSSGTLGNLITFGVYGLGTRPIITGADIVNGFAIDGSLSNVWNATISTQPNVVIFSGIPGTLVASKAACTFSGAWYWTGTVLSVYATSNPSGITEAGQRARAMTTANNGYLQFRSIDFRAGNDNTDSLISYKSPGTQIDLFDLKISCGAGNGMEVWNTSPIGTFSSIEIYNNQGDGILFSNEGTITLTGSSIHDNGLGSTFSVSGGVRGAIGGSTFTNNTITNNGRGSGVGTQHGIYGAASTNPYTATGNTCTGHVNGSGIKARGSAVIKQNTTLGNAFCGIELGYNGTTNVVYVVTGNIVGNNADGGINETSKGSGIISLTAENNTLYNNGFPAEIVANDNLNVLVLKNNIAYASPSRYAIKLTVTQSSAIIDYNDGYRTDASVSIYYNSGSATFTTWQGLGYDSHGLNSNPLFLDTASYNFYLQPTSPCRDTGTIIAGINDGTSGSTLYFNTAPDIGAIEYSGSTYYVANAGSDGNFGLLASLPWQTMAKVSASLFGAGDFVLLNRGDKWYETLTVPSSGTSGSSITFSAYGSGSNPLLTGASIATTKTWGVYSASIYSSTGFGGSPSQVFQGNARLALATSLAGMTSGSWFGSGSTTYIWATDNSNVGTNTTIELSHDFGTKNHAGSVVMVSGSSWITFNGLDLTRGQNSGYEFAASIGSDHIIIQNCTSSWHKISAVRMDAAVVSGSHTNILIDHVVAQDNLNECFWLGNGSGTTIQYCEGFQTVNDYANGYTVINNGGINVNGSTGLLAQYNYFHDIHGYQGVIFSIEYQVTYGRSTNVIYQYNTAVLNASTAAGQHQGLSLQGGAGCIAHHNIIYAPSGLANIRGGGFGNGGTGQLVSNNTFYGTWSSKCWNYNVDMGTANDFKNNIVFNINSVSHIDASAIGLSGGTSDYNCFAGLGSFAYTGSTFPNFAAWQSATVGDAHSISTDPLFTNSGSNDFRLRITSPARNVGLLVSGVNDNYRESAPDIGAIEYIPGTNTTLHSTGQNATKISTNSKNPIAIIVH